MSLYKVEDEVKEGELITIIIIIIDQGSVFTKR